MNVGQTVFSQLIEHLPHKEFQKCVVRYGGSSYVKSFSCWDQFLSMAFAQLTYRESLRDIEACLRSMESKLYHMGFRGKISRSTLADANESRDWRIYADFAQVLISIARPLYADDPLGVELNENLYALDSTTIDLCLSVFPWARFRQHKAAVKLHTLLDLHGSIPTFIRITEGKTHDVNILDQFIPEAGSFYVMDRGYVDFERLYILGLFVTVFLLLAMVLAWQLGGLPPESLALMRGTAWALALCVAAITVLSWKYFFITPIVSSIVITVCLIAPAWRSAKPIRCQ